MHCNHFRCEPMLETHSPTARAAPHMQSNGESMQGRSACIRVKATVDFCCAVPFLISIATTVHSSLSPSISVSVPPPSLSHTQSLLCWKTQIWFFVSVPTFTLSLSQTLCLANICHPWQPGHCSSHQIKPCCCRSSRTLLSFYNVFKNLNVCNVAFSCCWCSFQKGLFTAQWVHCVVWNLPWAVHNSMKLEVTLLSTTWKMHLGVTSRKQTRQGCTSLMGFCNTQLSVSAHPSLHNRHARHAWPCLAKWENIS